MPDPVLALKGMASDVYFELAKGSIEKYKNINYVLFDSIEAESFGGAKIGDVIAHYMESYSETTISVAASKIPALMKGLTIVGGVVSVGAGILDVLHSENPQMDALKQYLMITSGIVAATLLTPVIAGVGVPALIAGGLAAVAGGLLSYSIDAVWSNAQTIAAMASQGIIAAEEAAAQISNLVSNKFNELMDSAGSIAQQALEQAKANIDSAIDALKGIADDYGWALDNPQPVLDQLPHWLQPILQPLFGTPGMNIAGTDNSPLIIDLNGNGVELTTLAASTARFDFRGEGFAEKMAWATGGDGFLVRDLNNNGTIDNVSEMFGTQETLAGLINKGFDQLQSTENGFAKLKLLDSNNDGKIDAADIAWASLKVWVDANGDGITDTGELLTMAQAGIQSLDVSHYVLDSYYGNGNFGHSIAGNTITHSGTALMTDGTTHKVVDAWLKGDNMDAIYTGDYTLDVRTLFLPTVRGYGMLPDLHVAMSMDNGAGGLLDKVAAFAASHTGTSWFTDGGQSGRRFQTSCWTGPRSTCRKEALPTMACSRRWQSFIS